MCYGKVVREKETKGGGVTGVSRSGGGMLICMRNKIRCGCRYSITFVKENVNSTNF